MLQTYRRHRETCEHKEDRKYARCRCPIWLAGRSGGVKVRETLNEYDWDRAQDLAREWEATATQAVNPRGCGRRSAKATAQFLADAARRPPAQKARPD